MKKIFRMAAFMLALGSMTAGFTSCGDDEATDIDEQINFDGLNVVAQSNGKILVDGKVTANTKIKSLVLSKDAEGKEVLVDLLKSGDQEKVKAINEEGEKEKSFTLSIPTAEVDVDEMYLVGKTKGDKKASSAITETLKYNLGSASSAKGSYLSIIDNKLYTQTDAEADPSKVEVIAESVKQSDGKTYFVEGVKRASEAKSSIINSGCGKIALFDVNGNPITTGAVTTGTIITASGAICKFSVETGKEDVIINGITIKSGLGAIKKVDVSKFTFSK